MKIVVCIKISQGEAGPFDGAALETALRWDGAEITVVCMGPASARGALEKLTRLGNFRTILISDPVFAGADTLATARTLARCIRELVPDLVLCGRQTLDGDTAQVGPELAAMLDFTLVANVMEVGDSTCVTRLGVVPYHAPAVLTLERTCELRFPSLRSRVKNVEVVSNTELQIPPELCGQAGSPTRVLKTFEAKTGTRKCRWIARNELPELLETLRKRPSRTTSQAESTVKLPEVWVVGAELQTAGNAIARNVVTLDRAPVAEIVARIQRETPEVVLWPADTWGRTAAPQAAARLQTGLCADCTALETDGVSLFMYRPAFGGNVYAKIECRTRPQMATVRTLTTSGDILVAAGRGVSNETDLARLWAWADTLRAERGASRGLVDSGKVPYAMQVGLTGRTVAPKIYIAVGISGAVQHTCAIEGSETIVAWNPDRHARIFDFADYGICEEY